VKKRHSRTLKFHTVFTVALTVVFAFVLLITKSLSLGVAMIFLALYVAGNGIIHVRRNELARDTIVEYILIGVIAALLLVSSFVHFTK
jgi:predicted permease